MVTARILRLCLDENIASSRRRSHSLETIVQVVGGLFALGVLMAGVALSYRSFKEGPEGQVGARRFLYLFFAFIGLGVLLGIVLIAIRR